MPRDLPPRTGPGRVVDPSGVRSRDVREETEPLVLPADWKADAPELDDDPARDDEPAALPPLSAAAMGTHDRPPTRMESPAARRPPSGARGPRTPAAHPTPAAPAPERAEDRIGSTLGAYRLHALIGKGGMGFVYRAEHAKLGREVALKLLRSDYARRRESVARFFQEARTVNRIRHRNIVDVTDFVELEDGTTFIIMELLRGQSLGSWARHAFELPRALGLLLQICDGLAAAHAVGVIHRDLKPDNVVVMPTDDGTELVKLLDFGVAKLLNRDDEDLGLETAAGSVIGTPAYMSPEQAGGLPIDARADIYSLGAIMYELFCGQPLFRGRSFGEYVRKHLSELPVPPRETARGAALDPRLEHIILRSLEKDPARRYQTVEALRHELLELLAELDPDGLAPVRLHRSARMDAASVPVHLTPPARPPGPPGPVTPPARPSALLTPAPWPPRLTPPPSAPLSSTTHPGAGFDPGLHPTPYPGAESLVRLDPGLAPRAGRRVWMVALATIAAGIAVAGVLVAAARGRSHEAHAPATPPPLPPTAAPPQVTEHQAGSAAPGSREEPESQAPRLIDVRVDGPAGARVLRADDEVELCVAPCQLALAAPEGDAPTRRDFIVRLAGHADQPLTIDLASPPPSITVPFDDEAADGALAHRRPGRPGDPAATSPTPASPTTIVPPATPAGPRPPVTATAATTTTTTTTPPTTTPTTTAPPATPRKRPTIDPTDTIDPFANEK